MLLAVPGAGEAPEIHLKTNTLAAYGALIVACMHGSALAATGEIAQAEAARKKPLQRCDQLKDDAELECLKKARERIVEARKKRESAGKGDQKKLDEKQDEKALKKK